MWYFFIAIWFMAQNVINSTWIIQHSFRRTEFHWNSLANCSRIVSPVRSRSILLFTFSIVFTRRFNFLHIFIRRCLKSSRARPEQKSSNKLYGKLWLDGAVCFYYAHCFLEPNRYFFTSVTTFFMCTSRGIVELESRLVLFFRRQPKGSSRRFVVQTMLRP